MTTRERLEAAALALIEAGFGETYISLPKPHIAEVESLARLEGAKRATFRYKNGPDRNEPYAIDRADIEIRGVCFIAQFARPLRDGESMEADWRSQAERDGTVTP